MGYVNYGLFIQGNPMQLLKNHVEYLLKWKQYFCYIDKEFEQSKILFL